MAFPHKLPGQFLTMAGIPLAKHLLNANETRRAVRESGLADTIKDMMRKRQPNELEKSFEGETGAALIRHRPYLDKVMKAHTQAMVDSMQDIGDMIVERAVSRVPTGGGNLARSIFAVPLPPNLGVGVEVQVLSSYGAYVEWGTGLFTEWPGAPRKRIKPKEAKALVWTKRGVPRPPKGANKQWERLAEQGLVTYAKSIAGQHPQPYIRPAIDEVAGNEKLMEEIFRLNMQRMRMRYGIPSAKHNQGGT